MKTKRSLAAVLALTLMLGVAPTVASVTAAPARAATIASPAQAKEIAKKVVKHRGWVKPKQYKCLVTLWNRESGWRVTAYNASSGAYGIPQALPGSKMSAYGSNWRTSALTQIKWGTAYIQGRYSKPCIALDHSNRYGWY